MDKSTLDKFKSKIAGKDVQSVPATYDEPDGSDVADDSDMDKCIGDAAKAISMGDEDGIVYALKQLVLCIKQEDEEEDKTE